MKKIFIYIISAAAFLQTGCSKFIEGYDVSPNSPTVVTASLLLTNAEVALIATETGQLARTSSILIQSVAGTDAQMLDVEAYRIYEGDNQNEWDLIYQDGMEACEDLINNYADDKSYTGVAKVLKAIYLGLATDLWGDIPASEALQGINNFTPKFDAQKDVLAMVQSLLSDGIADLTDASGAAIGSDDLMYGGDNAAWISAAYALKARYALRMSKTPDYEGDAAVLGYLASAGMTSSEQDLNSVFGTLSNDRNSWTSFEAARPNYIKMGANFVTTLQASGDPRLAFYSGVDTGGIYRGSILGAGDNTASPIGSYLRSTELPIVSYVETKFIEAEVKFASNKAGAAEAFNEAVKASLRHVTGDQDAAYIANYASETAATITMDKINGQRYIALFGQIEAYSCWRRTDFPALTPNPNGVVGSIPVRFPTPIDERLYNSKATVIGDVTLPVWWDQ